MASLTKHSGLYGIEKPLCIDLFCGLGGWADGFLSEGFRVIGFDIEQQPYPAQRVIQDVTTIHGSQFRDAAVIVASPPCQEYSYMAMPWKRAKQIEREYKDGTRDTADLTRLFDACFRIQREASEAAGHKVPLIVENVRGAQKWVGRAAWHYGSYFLWGDVPALMPVSSQLRHKFNPDGTNHGQGSWFRIADSKNRGSKNNGGSWFNIAHNTASGVGQNPDGRKVRQCPKCGGPVEVDHNSYQCHECQMLWPLQDEQLHPKHKPSKLVGKKQAGDWFGTGDNVSLQRKHASAMIAKIPFPLARHIAWVFRNGLVVSIA